MFFVMNVFKHLHKKFINLYIIILIKLFFNKPIIHLDKYNDDFSYHEYFLRLTTQSLNLPIRRKSQYYDEIKLEDMDYNESELAYYYPCPCGDTFRIGLYELYDGEDIGICQSCTLRIKIIFEEKDLPVM